jgi:hypothetical protein
MKYFARILALGWLLLLLAVASAFIAPKSFSHIFFRFAIYFPLVPLLLLISTAIFVLLKIYSRGIKRPSNPI